MCISGHVRDYRYYSKKLFERWIAPNPGCKFDLFISTWDTVNSKNTHAAIRRGYIDGTKVDERDII